MSEKKAGTACPARSEKKEGNTEAILHGGVGLDGRFVFVGLYALKNRVSRMADNKPVHPPSNIREIPNKRVFMPDSARFWPVFSGLAAKKAGTGALQEAKRSIAFCE
ncbi:MAG: hypothetical protein MI741_05530 [Rhodospirillales bacterium]|nr:hypothetical protein [Rhodospirillales bacterium]